VVVPASECSNDTAERELRAATGIEQDDSDAKSLFREDSQRGHVAIIYSPRMGTDLRGWLWTLQMGIRVFPCNPWFFHRVACKSKKMLQVIMRKGSLRLRVKLKACHGNYRCRKCEVNSLINLVETPA
jgi:hypothetical protein